ncbi:hypothetical protein NEUTE1DRAFT_76176 [Neurospora tetrasperma FGSC 2508]|uniref:DNA polymerase n=1 Tax=Neurospora tetrasperma (strain FGSC 2508 / ATCC MYA-4615 / P0657) TaxID=510951 RepID=F8ME75_NEUT8|nr:uncharacterized protein NEUTE1DRAFT_76176 [Neurospora tetrasperma FGSC 2508]EGO60759.1 hypothetical protein NEUTE1DRAFT_76176 [Neurospora tetrasperma FGSC 2508]EGZ75251.1 Nucleotidyltransferase [Neurospora tetrasperma FGSC 2509]
MTLDFPVIFLLPTNLGADELHELEEQIPTLTYDINEAEVILGNVHRKQRVLFELRKHKLVTEEISTTETDEPTSPSLKRRRFQTPGSVITEDSDTASDGDFHPLLTQSTQSTLKAAPTTVKVVKLAWFTESLKAGTVLPIEDYTLYRGRKQQSKPAKLQQASPAKAANIIKRALADPKPSSHGSRPGSSHSTTSHGRRDHFITKAPALLHMTTSEHEVELPPIPAYLHTTYACQRPAPTHPPNEPFIEELTKIRTARTLLGDKIGVRAYSSAIAALISYPYLLQSAFEVARLPGCGLKIAQLYQEFREQGELQEAKEDESDPRLAVLKLFHEIWGVAETTAREFYNKGWRDLDDIIEYGWDTLTRVQQIGVKYYDEFQQKIPRAEVESIANIILEHANKIHPGFQMVIVGGYRRGKLASGDVDVVLSHPDKAATRGFVEQIVVALEQSNYITHTLILSTANTERGQEPVAWKGNEKKSGTGFDTLDKALVVWQDPHWTTGEKKNPNPHRRVDIIISPWKTAGCAVLGWTSGTTFQRDLRRYCKKERSLKFDSSGIRSRADGTWVDFESGPNGEPAPDMLTAERRVFEGLGLEWRPPEERCTG